MCKYIVGLLSCQKLSGMLTMLFVSIALLASLFWERFGILIDIIVDIGTLARSCRSVVEPQLLTLTRRRYAFHSKVLELAGREVVCYDSRSSLTLS